MEAKRLYKLAQTGSQLFMSRVLSIEEEVVEGSRETRPHILTLTDEYHRLFSDSKELFPFRGIFYHKIPLQQGRNPVNARPYMHSSSQKNIIELLVKKMLN